jgi:hypothetical protein
MRATAGHWSRGPAPWARASARAAPAPSAGQPTCAVPGTPAAAAGNSKEDFRDAANFTVFIGKEGAEKLKEAKIEDPAAYYKNKTIRVTGVVKLYRDKPEIVMEKADQIQVVEKK